MKYLCSLGGCSKGFGAIKRVKVTDMILCYCHAIAVLQSDGCCSISLKLLIFFSMFIVRRIYAIIALYRK